MSQYFGSWALSLHDWSLAPEQGNPHGGDIRDEDVGLHGWSCLTPEGTAPGPAVYRRFPCTNFAHDPGERLV